jgi:hypothetical protein
LPVAFACALTCLAQDPPPAGKKPEREPTTTLFFARTGESTGESLLGPYTAAIHYLEFLQIRDRWILPDIGYINFGHGNYHEYYIGGGRTLIENRYTSFDQELLYLGTAGSAAGGAKYLQPWSMLRVRFTPKFTNETVYFLYLPVNRVHIAEALENRSGLCRREAAWRVPDQQAPAHDDHFDESGRVRVLAAENSGRRGSAVAVRTGLYIALASSSGGEIAAASPLSLLQIFPRKNG